jgi:5-methylcytosine-specific restriction protein A
VGRGGTARVRVPTRPPRACGVCGVACNGARCPLHPVVDTRPSASRRGYGVQWREIRRAVIARDPICVSCMVERSTDVDHRVPRARGGSDSPANLVGLCHSCHSRKTAREDRGFGNTKRATA